MHKRPSSSWAIFSAFPQSPHMKQLPGYTMPLVLQWLLYKFLSLVKMGSKEYTCGFQEVYKSYSITTHTKPQKEEKIYLGAMGEKFRKQTKHSNEGKFMHSLQSCTLPSSLNSEYDIISMFKKLTL